MNSAILGPPQYVTQKALASMVLTWFPLFFLSMIDGLAFNNAKIPFVYDIASHSRFLFAVPVLILIEIPIARRLNEVTRYLIEAGLVTSADKEPFGHLVSETLWLNRSKLIAFALLAFAYVCIFLRVSLASENGDVWLRQLDGSGPSWAGAYYMFICLPIFYFLVFRWVFRVLVWTRLLWQVSRFKLVLTPTHPDGSGGLGFVGKSSPPFGFILFVLSAVVSGAIANRILFAGASLEQFRFDYIAFVLFTLLIATLPLMVFVPTLIRLKHSGLRKYGVLASQYTQQFDRKWLSGERSKNEPLLGSADIQSLADLANASELVRKMRVIPIEPRDFIAILILGFVPAIPLAFLVLPVSEILQRILKLLA